MTAWSQTVGQLCLSAAMELGAVGLGDSLDAAEEAEMTTRLNSMLAKWSIEANLFRETVITVTVTGGTGAVALPDTVRDVRSVWLIQSAISFLMLAMWNCDKYVVLSNSVLLD